MKTVAELVNDLFRTHRKENGREFTHQEIAEALGGRIDPTNISKIRTGKIKDPRRETLLALCLFFKVPGSYFFPELAEYDVQNQETSDIILLATRSSLNEEAKKKLDELIDAMRDKKE